MRQNRAIIAIVSVGFALAILIAGTAGAVSICRHPSPFPLVEPGQEIEDSSASLTILDGEVFIRRLGAGLEEWVALTENTWVVAGDTIKTGENGAAVLTFLDGTESILDSGTELTVEALELGEDRPVVIQLRLWIGSTWNRIEKFVVPDSRYQIYTPSAALVARGTSWWVYVDEARRTWVIIIDGQVDIEGEYTLGMPPNWSPDGSIPADQITENPDGSVVGRGVAAQAYFIAQELATVLSPEELNDLKQKLGVESDITDTDLVDAFKSGTMTWGDIKKLTGNPGSSDGNLGAIVSSGNDNKPDKEDKSNQGNSDKGNSGGGKKK